MRENLYEEIEKIITKTPNRDMIFLTGDFNAKVGSDNRDYPENIGKYGKGMINSSGKVLLETCQRNNLIVTNTLFPHKLSHRTTWTAPYRVFITKNGEKRRNPIRNQIDYVIVRNQHRRFIKDSRSYGGINLETDHKLVKTEVRIEWHKIISKMKS